MTMEKKKESFEVTNLRRAQRRHSSARRNRLLHGKKKDLGNGNRRDSQFVVGYNVNPEGAGGGVLQYCQRVRAVATGEKKRKTE